MINENLSQLIEIIKKEPGNLSLLVEMLKKNEANNTKEEVQPSDEVPIEIINDLQEIYSGIPPTQFVYEIIQKLKLPDLAFQFDEDSEYKWKCTVTIPETKFIAEGYNNSKREAKSID